MTVTKVDFDKKFRAEAELCERLNAVINDYIGDISTVATLGVLELVKYGVLDRAMDSVD